MYESLDFKLSQRIPVRFEAILMASIAVLLYLLHPAGHYLCFAISLCMHCKTPNVNSSTNCGDDYHFQLLLHVTNMHP